MRRLRSIVLLAALGVAGLARADEPEKLPEACRGFLATKRTKLVRVLGGYEWKYEGLVSAVALSPDGHSVLASVPDLRLCDASSGREVRRFDALDPEGSFASCLAFSPDGKLVASGNDSFVALWNPETGKCTGKVKRPGVKSVVFSPDGKHLATTTDSAVKIWDLGEDEGTFGASIDLPTSSSGELAYSRDGKLILSGGNGALQLWELPSGKLLRAFPVKAGTSVKGVALLPDGSRALSATSDTSMVGELTLWDAKKGTAIRSLRRKRSSGLIASVSFAPNGKLAWAGGACLTPWNLEDGTEGQSLEVARAYPCAFSGDSRLAVTGSRGIHVFDLDVGREVSLLVGHHQAVNALAVQADGSRIVSSGDDGTVRVWDAASGQEVACLGDGKPEHRVDSIAVSPDGSHLIRAATSFASGT